MLDAGEKIKQILYSEIENIGKEKIQAQINSNIESSQKYIDKIMSECIRKLTYESNDYNDDDDYNITIATLCEVLLHFMLTICTLPSERKIRVKNDLILDVIIPNLQSLKIKSDKSIIIQVIKDKTMMDLNKTSQLEFLQPNHKNIWLISATPLSAIKYTIYTVFPNSALLHNYSNIIIDIDNFLKETEDKSFRFIH
jgi:hypothetical protein